MLKAFIRADIAMSPEKVLIFIQVSKNLQKESFKLSMLKDMPVGLRMVLFILTQKKKINELLKMLR